ncbi:prepilin peptidase [Pseudoduganella sp. GCM10020061]|uniref:A24 family peptidase n=1 Tax=Pseudoduganella sp. GCM10020061 TaxID=3317345 RepID=UPI00362AF46F
MNTSSEFAAFLDLAAMLVTDPRTGVLLALLTTAAVIDYRTFKIPNWLTGGGLAFALAYNILVPPQYNAAWYFAPAGMMVGLLLTLPMYVMRIMGAGDVKLMAMVGAFLGPGEAVFALLYSFIAAGIAALAFGMNNGVMGRMLGNLRYIATGTWLPVATSGKPSARTASVGHLAFGLSIAVGTTVLVVGRHFNFI